MPPTAINTVPGAVPEMPAGYTSAPVAVNVAAPGAITAGNPAAATGVAPAAAGAATCVAPTVAGQRSGYMSLPNVVAATTTGSADQLALSLGNGVMANIVQPAQPRNVKITVTDLIVAAVALAIRRIPAVNSAWLGDGGGPTPGSDRNPS